MIKVSGRTTLALIYFIPFALQILAVTNFDYLLLPQLFSTILFLISGCVIAILPFVVKREAGEIDVESKSDYRNGIILFATFLVALMVFVIIETAKSLSRMPIDYHNADMIPQIKVCCERLIKGEKVYAPMMEVWNGKLTTYFPMMWLPYLPLEYLGYDVRWTGAILLSLFFALYLFLIPKKQPLFHFLLPVILLSAWIFWFLFYDQWTYIALTEESVVIGFYLFLGFALVKNNAWLIGIAAVCCLLSRYVLVFWIPAYIIYCWFFESKKFSLKVAGISGVLFTLIFFIPFGMGNLDYFVNSTRQYLTDAMEHVPHGQDYYVNLGFAQHLPNNQLPMLHKLDKLVSMMIPALSLLLFALFRKRLMGSHRYFGLCSLQLTMAIFYTIVVWPFYYLFFVPVFFSLPIIFQAMNERPLESIQGSS